MSRKHPNFCYNFVDMWICSVDMWIYPVDMSSICYLLSILYTYSDTPLLIDLAKWFYILPPYLYLYLYLYPPSPPEIQRFEVHF